MGLINLTYLALGLGMGVGSSWLFGIKSQKQHDNTNKDISSLKEAIALPETKQDISSCQEATIVLNPDVDVPHLQEKLKQTQLAYQMAVEMSQFKAGFLARTSHELRSPLSSMIGLHQLILSDLCEDPAEEREFVTQAHTSALKLVKLIDEIIAVAKTEHGTTNLEIQPLQLAGVLDEVYNLTHLQAANRSLRFSLSSPDPEIYILADRRRLRQVLVNLVDSAIYFMQEGTINITTSSAPASGCVRIWIDAPCPESAWQEPIDLLQSNLNTQSDRLLSKDTASSQLSPGLNLLINQILIEVMQGRLELVDLPPEYNEDSQGGNFTRIQCSIPLVSVTSDQ